jgi:hypothetical protein
MLGCLQSGKADTWKECVDQYDDRVHKWILEENSRRTLEAAQPTQAAAQNAASNAAWAAIGIWFR